MIRARAVENTSFESFNIADILSPVGDITKPYSRYQEPRVLGVSLSGFPIDKFNAPHELVFEPLCPCTLLSDVNVVANVKG
jgi:hypothetical protein